MTKEDKPPPPWQNKSRGEGRGRGGGARGESSNWPSRDDRGTDDDRGARNQAKGGGRRGGKGDSRQDHDGEEWEWHNRDWSGGGERRRGGPGGYTGSDAWDSKASKAHDEGHKGGDDGVGIASQTPQQKYPLWKEYRDPETDDFYYYNAKTGLTQWEKPAELEPLKPAVSEGYGATDRSREHASWNRRERDGDRDDTRGGRDRDRDRDGGGRNDRGGVANAGGKQAGGKKGGGKRNSKADQDAADFGPPGCNLFVFHLPDDWTDDDLHEYFCPHGNIVSAKVMKEIGTGRSRGFGFASYEDRISAATAIKKMQGYKILGKRLKVEFKKGEVNDCMDDVAGENREDENASASKKSYPDDERLIGYLRAISAKNVVQSLKESESAARSEDAAQTNDAGVDHED